MYQCPLCPSSNLCYATFDSLNSHIDIAHCPISGPSKLSKDIKLLENRINKFINFELNRTNIDFIRKLSSIDQVHARKTTRFDSLRSVGNRNNVENAELFFPKDYEYVKLENDHLKQRLRDLERKWQRDSEVVEGRNLSLQNDLHHVTTFLKDAQKMQEKGKKDLKKFMSDLLGDLEHKEKMIFELNQHILDKEEEQISAAVEHPQSSYNLPYMTRMSAQSRKPSGLSLDSGYHEDPFQKRPQSFIIRHSKKPASDSTNNFQIADMNEPGTSDEMKNVYSINDSALGKVFQYLDTMTLLKCATICRKWKKVAENPLFWRRIHMENVDISLKQMTKLSNYCSQTIGITLKAISVRFDPDNIQTTNIKGILEHGMETIFKACGEFLTFLKIVDCCPYLTDRTLWLATCHCRNLKQLIYVSQNFPLSPPVVWSIGASCRSIETLIAPQSKKIHSGQKKMDSYLKFNDNCLLMIARCWPRTMKTLSISGLHITLAGLSQIAEHCETMEIFEIENYPSLNLNDAQHICRKGLNYLQRLNFVQTKIDSSAVLWFCEYLPRLQSVLVLWKTESNQQNSDDYLTEILKLQKLKETNANVDKMLRIILKKT